MREALIGIITAVVAITAYGWLRAAPSVAAGPPVTQVWSGTSAAANRIRNRPPTTQPDPAAVKFEKTVDVVFNKLPLGEAIRYLRDVTGANVWVNWRVLDVAGIEPKQEVTLDLQQVQAIIALRFLLLEASNGSLRLGYRFQDGVLMISTIEDLARDTVTRVYDVRDLILELMKGPIFPTTRPVQSIQPAGPPTPATQPSGGGLFGGGAYRYGYDEPLTEQEASDALVRLIQETISPTVWREAGGSTGAVRALRGRLVVTLCPEDHSALEIFLERLREVCNP